jgi:hypothetical protein
MRFSEQQRELFRYVDNQTPRYLGKGISLIEGLDNSEFIDFKDSKYHYTIAKQDITPELIAEYYDNEDDTEDSLEEYVFKYVYKRAVDTKEKIS